MCTSDNHTDLVLRILAHRRISVAMAANWLSRSSHSWVPTAVSFQWHVSVAWMRQASHISQSSRTSQTRQQNQPNAPYETIALCPFPPSSLLPATQRAQSGSVLDLLHGGPRTAQSRRPFARQAVTCVGISSSSADSSVAPDRRLLIKRDFMFVTVGYFA